MKRRILHILIGLDQFLWCLVTLGHSHPDITLSAAAYVSEARGKRWAKVARPVIDWLFRPIERNHCRRAYMAELARREYLDV